MQASFRTAGVFVYTADSAMVTEYNLEVLGGNNFITRLPFNYKEADLAVSKAVRDKSGWEKVSLKESSKVSRPGQSPNCMKLQ